jgi:hypothetical protein
MDTAQCVQELADLVPRLAREHGGGAQAKGGDGYFGKAGRETGVESYVQMPRASCQLRAHAWHMGTTGGLVMSDMR